MYIDILHPTILTDLRRHSRRHITIVIIIINTNNNNIYTQTVYILCDL